MVYIFANFAGLAKTLVEHKALESLASFEASVSGFNKFDSFHFVDAGRGKECTDNKIRGQPGLLSYLL